MSDTTRPDGLPRLIEVKVDVELHGGKEPKSESQRLTWEVLDTVWKLMREYSVRVTLAEIRDQLAERGETFPSDEELFKDARESGDPAIASALSSPPMNSSPMPTKRPSASSVMSG